MVYQKISDDLKEAALWLMACGHDTVYDIAAVTGFSVHTLYCAHHQKLHTGSVAKAEDIGHGWPRTLARRYCDYLLRPVLITPPHIPTRLQESSRIPTGFLPDFNNFSKRHFHMFLHFPPTGLQVNLNKIPKSGCNASDIGFLSDSYWIPTGVSYNSLLQMPRAKLRSCD